MIVGCWRFRRDSSVGPLDLSHFGRGPPASRTPAAQRASKSPRLINEPGGGRLALSGAQRLQQESDFCDPTGPLAHISLQYEILALARNEREGRELGHQHRENRCGNQPTQQRPRPEGYPHSLLHFIYCVSTVTPTT
jgi:hypothetical protein